MLTSHWNTHGRRDSLHTVLHFPFNRVIVTFSLVITSRVLLLAQCVTLNRVIVTFSLLITSRFLLLAHCVTLSLQLCPCHVFSTYHVTLSLATEWFDRSPPWTLFKAVRRRSSFSRAFERITWDSLTVTGEEGRKNVKWSVHSLFPQINQYISAALVFHWLCKIGVVLLAWDSGFVCLTVCVCVCVCVWLCVSFSTPWGGSLSVCFSGTIFFCRYCHVIPVCLLSQSAFEK